MKHSLSLLLCCLLTGTSFAQLTPDNTKWMEYIEELADSDTDETSLEDLYNDLSYLTEHPFDLHSLKKENLERLPFLSEIQIENILYYLYRHSPVYSLYELRNVRELDIQTIEYLLPFITLSQKEDKPESLNARRMIRYAKQEVLFRYDQCLQEKSGYKEASEEEKEEHPSRYYLGESFYTSLKYNLQYKDRLQVGFVGEKDAGEPSNRFDYYSAHLSLKNIGKLKHLLIGDYRLSFGQGLVVNTDFNLSNTSDVMNIGRKAGGIKRHYSTGEANHFRGIASLFNINTVDISVFYSQREVDASADDSTIYSLKTDGYRRTPNDLLKKNQAQTRVVGGNIQWKNDFLSLGLTSLYHDFRGKKLDPDWKPYNHFYLRDTDNYTVGTHYSIRRRLFFFQGETAVSKNKALAAYHALQVYPAASIRFALRHRYFAKDYQAQYASVAGSTTVQNMNAWYLGCVIEPFAYWKLSASVDFIEYPWLKYLVDSPSRASYSLVNLDYFPNKKYSMSLRYTFREKWKNFAVETQASKAVLPYDQHSLRYQFQWKQNSGFYTKWQISGKLYKSSEESSSKGAMISQSCGYTKADCPLQGDFFLGYFHTNDWDSRISTYEKSILHAFSIPSFSGEGLRSGFTAKWNISSFLSVQMKLAWTHYMDRDVIGSGLEAIEGKDKVDVYGLIRMKW